jgi:beta-lactamase class A
MMTFPPINRIVKYAFTGLIFLSGPVFAQDNTVILKNQINHIIDAAGGKFGIGVEGVDFKAGFVINGNHGYPMQSVFKFPLALTILHQVDLGKLHLGQQFDLDKATLDTVAWSPMLKEFPGRYIHINLAQLLSYAVTSSDNNACDFLFKVAGGPAVVDAYIHDSGVKDIAIKFTEGEMAKAWPLQYQNWCKPAAMLQLLQLLYHQKLLSKTSNNFLIRIMTEVPGWDKRISALLPPGTKLIHKTGSSGVNAQGMLAATNDVGIVTLPNGRHLAIVVFASDYKGPRDRGGHIIALIAKQIWNHYTKNN